MAKKKNLYMCLSCYKEHSQWQGQCSGCNQWNSLELVKTTQSEFKRKTNADGGLRWPCKMSEIRTEKLERTVTEMTELNRVLGGGIVPGSLTLIGGDPGVGKSTLMLKMVSELEGNSHLYVSAEETYSQIKDRASRINLSNLNLDILVDSNWENIKLIIKKSKYKIVVIDSIQTICSNELMSQAGSPSQLKELTNDMMKFSKTNNVAIFIIGHITKDGQIAGPKMLEHMVDTVLYFKKDEMAKYRKLVPIKNRFGTVEEVGLFEMKENNFLDVIDPSQIALSEQQEKSIGSVISSVMKGTRPLLVEIETLVADNNSGPIKRVINGISQNKVAIVLAIIEKEMGIQTSIKDLFVNMRNNISSNESSIDLGILAAILSSIKNREMSNRSAYLGEISLSGKVKSPKLVEQHLKMLDQLNYKKVYTSKKVEEEYQEQFPIKIIGLEGAKDILEFI